MHAVKYPQYAGRSILPARAKTVVANNDDAMSHWIRRRDRLCEMATDHTTGCRLLDTTERTECGPLSRLRLIRPKQREMLAIIQELAVASQVERGRGPVFRGREMRLLGSP